MNPLLDQLLSMAWVVCITLAFSQILRLMRVCNRLESRLKGEASPSHDELIETVAGKPSEPAEELEI